tara:strand:- start:1043 stop:1291 length:249 start_codon:yes stop_codon:yes gene_type:complete
MDERKEKIEELEEIKKIFEEVKFEEKKKQVNIIWDKIQYSIRIPKKFAEIMEIDTKKDKFEFLIKGSKEQPELRGGLIKNAE